MYKNIENEVKYHLARGGLAPITICSILEDKKLGSRKDIQRALSTMLDNGLLTLDRNMNVCLYSLKVEDHE